MVITAATTIAEVMVDIMVVDMVDTMEVMAIITAVMAVITAVMVVITAVMAVIMAVMAVIMAAMDTISDGDKVIPIDEDEILVQFGNVCQTCFKIPIIISVFDQ